jgi:hypothetical protein
VLAGKFTWTVRNFSLFREMIKTQKIMSPAFPAGECKLRLSVYQVHSLIGRRRLQMDDRHSADMDMVELRCNSRRYHASMRADGGSMGAGAVNISRV